MDHTIKTLLKNLSTLDQKDILSFTEQISDLQTLYNKIGSKISSQTILSSIKDTDQDLYALSLFIDKNGLRSQLDRISNILHDEFDITRTTLISSSDNELIKSKLSQSDGKIVELANNKIWAYVKKWDQIFSRDVDKDIDKLIRS